MSVYGNRIAELTGLSKAWLGLVLMASVTSLPELITGISSVAIVKEPNLAAGDIFGSCVFNLLILSVLDVFVKKPITGLIKTGHILSATCGIILIATSGIGIFISEQFTNTGRISIITPVVFIIYIASVWMIFRFEKKASGMIVPAEEKAPKGPSLKKTFILYGINASLVVIAALFLPYFGQLIAAQYGISETFFGTLFIAASTSLPELVISIAAVRINSIDLAVGNLFGSNIFNIILLGIDDIFFIEGSFYSRISPANLLSIFIVVIMAAVAIIGILFKPGRKKFLLAYDTLIIFILYIVLIVLLSVF